MYFAIVVASQRRCLVFGREGGVGEGGSFCMPNSSGKTVDLASTMGQSSAPTGAIACDQPLLSFLPKPGSKRFFLVPVDGSLGGERGATKGWGVSLLRRFFFFRVPCLGVRESRT